MFTLQCTTCNAKLAVKNENLIGQIVACPKCGSMVLIQPPEESLPIPNPFSDSSEEQEVPRPVVRFPDAVSERESSVATNLETVYQEIPPENSAEIEVIPESELWTRKILLAVISVLFILLLFAAGFLVMQKQPPPLTDGAAENTVNNTAVNNTTENSSPAPPVQDSEQNKTEIETAPLTVSPITNAAEQEPVSEDTIKKNTDEKDKLAELFALPMKVPPEQAKPDGNKESGDNDSTDVLAGIQKKMPDLLNDSAGLTLDIPNILNIPLKKWTLNKTPLLNVLRQFSELTEIPLTIDIDELLCRSIYADTPITISSENETAGKTLEKILQTVGLIFTVEENQITVSVPKSERDKIEQQNFEVSDIGAVLPIADLENYILQLVMFPKDGGIETAGSTICVLNTKRHLAEILRLTEQLRVLYGLKQKTEMPPEKLVPESFGWDAVCVPMTLNYYQPELLTDVLQQIEKTAKVQIIIDNRSLHRSLVSLKTLYSSIHCNCEPVNTALQRLLSSVDTADMNYRIVSANILEVSTAETLSKPEDMSIEIHRFETDDKKLSETPEELVRVLKAAVAPETWATPGNLNGGTVVIDKGSKCLFVRQSQPVQRELRLLLAKTR
ncbi:hypothetical protein FACS1894214_2660 [Planctomycetales bacterium]|nr:hypothetical protein FACS1894214_2660 [Planctomycetales bacterium]